MKRYSYFVYYTTEHGYGNMMVSFSNKITWDDIKWIEEDVKKTHGVDKVAVSNFILL